MILRPEVLPQALGALLLAALIVVLLRVGGRRPENRALAAFFAASCGFSLTSVLHVVTGGAGPPWAAPLPRTLGAIDAILLVRFADVYRRGSAPPAPREAVYLGGAALLAAASLADAAFAGGGALPLRAIDGVLDVAWVAVPFLLARGALRAPETRPWRSELLLATALGIVFAAIDATTPSFTYSYLQRPLATQDIVAIAAGDVRAVGLVALVAYLVAAGSRLPGRRRAATASALAILATMLVALAIAAAALSGWSRNGQAYELVFASVFLVQPVIVAYALLRHQLLDIDLKVKVGISRSALAAIFLAVFFVATQVAQNFLEGYGVLVGGAAAGLMLFAIAPLQRVAERFADAAMPGVGDRRPPSSREQAYKHALRFALRDRAVTREEELHLAHLADELGLPTQVAVRLRHEVEAEGASKA